MTAYAGAIRDFYTWMAERQAQTHAPEVAAVQAKQAEVWRAMAPEVPVLIENGLKIAAMGVGSLRDAFAFGLSPAEHAELANDEDDLPKWVNVALEIIQRKFGQLPPELVSRIREAAKSG